jgi:hypothetical protein
LRLLVELSIPNGFDGNRSVQTNEDVETKISVCGIEDLMENLRVYDCEEGLGSWRLLWVFVCVLRMRNEEVNEGDKIL